jgi:hypothetical protein
VFSRRDKTLVEILDRLESLEDKIDRIPTHGPVPTGFRPVSFPLVLISISRVRLHLLSRPDSQALVALGEASHTVILL